MTWPAISRSFTLRRWEEQRRLLVVGGEAGDVVEEQVSPG